MWITIYTDASHIPGTQKGAWAFWIKCDLGRITKNGVFKKPVRDSGHAEVCCIVNAVCAATSIWPNIKGIYIVTDSMMSISSFKKSMHSKADKKIQY